MILVVFMIFLSACISKSEEYKLIKQMEQEKDVEGLIDALESSLDSNYTSCCGAYAAKSLGEVGDKRAVESLIRALKTECDDVGDINYIREKAVTALAQIGEPSVGPIILLLEDDDHLVRKRAMNALELIRDEDAIPALKEILPNWYAGECVANALYHMGWDPNSSEEKIHYLVARRKKSSLKKNWVETKQVLLKDVESDDRAVVENAVYAFISIGDAEVIPDLINILDDKGNKIMAETYLNSGNKELSDAASNWARRNGYKITSGFGSSNVNWGSM